MACGYVAYVYQSIDCYLDGLIICSWSHVDPAYCAWAFSLCVGREVETLQPAGKKWAQKYVEGGGGNFVNVTLKVVVKAAVGTLFVFQPDKLHGTTLSYGATNRNMAITFSKHVADGYREMMEKGSSIFAGEGAGEGNPDNQKL